MLDHIPLSRKNPPELFLYPTESFYALGARATDRRAIQALFRLKQRDPSKPIALIAASLAQVQKYFHLSSIEKRLAKEYWPGSLTILLKPKGQIAARALGAGRIGVRVPAHAGARRLVTLAGAPLTATSANISGQPPTKSARIVEQSFPGILRIAGRCGRATKPSTVVDVRREQILILRDGAVTLR